MAAAENIYLARPESWYAYDSTTNQYALTDPKTGDPLNPNAVPSYITDEPKLKAGIDYLAARRDDVTLDIAYGAHETAADLGQEGWFEQRVANADYYGFEGFDHNPKDAVMIRRQAIAILGTVLDAGYHPTLDNFMACYNDRLRRQGNEPLDGFKARRDWAIGILSTPYFCYDVSADTQTGANIIQAKKGLRHMRDDAHRGAAFLGLNNAREWNMVANTGAQLQQGEMGRELRPLSCRMTLGFAHEDMARKAGIAGATVRTEAATDLSMMSALDMLTIVQAIEGQRTGLLTSAPAMNLGRLALTMPASS